MDAEAQTLAALHALLADRLEVPWPPPGVELPLAFASASRRVGKAALAPSEAEQAALLACGLDWPLSAWSVDDAARVVLLLDAARRASPAELVALTAETFRQGDSRERAAVLRALALLPRPEAHLALAIDACRSSVQTVFEAIACENPFPARHFPEPNFNQLVLKALFVGARLERIVGLPGRVTFELVRMANDYAKERLAAGRAVPEDISWLKRSTLDAPPR